MTVPAPITYPRLYCVQEDPYCELRGHFVGHYLTALAYATVSTGVGMCMGVGKGGSDGPFCQKIHADRLSPVALCFLLPCGSFLIAPHEFCRCHSYLYFICLPVQQATPR